MAFHFVIDKVGQAQAAVIHGEQEAFYLEGGIELGLHNLDGVEQFADTFKCKVLALHGDNHAVGGREGVHRDEAQAGAAVDEDEVVVLYNGFQQVA